MTKKTALTPLSTGVAGLDELLMGGFLSNRVADNGPGVPPENRARIFQRHVRLAPDRRQAESHWKRGLGLYSAELFTQLHSGSLSVEDGANGEGVVFVLRLPVNPFAEEKDGLPRRQPPSQDSAPAKVRPQYTAPNTVP